MTDQQILFHIRQTQDATKWHEAAVIDAVAERMIDDDSDDDAREAARQRVREVWVTHEFNLIGG